MGEMPIAQAIGNPAGLLRLLRWLGLPISPERFEAMGHVELELLYYSAIHEARFGGV